MVWGGWWADGQKKFKQLRAKVEDARGQDHVPEMERQCMLRLKAKYDAQGPKVVARADNPRLEREDDSDIEL